jgi:hypothetical protein
LDSKVAVCLIVKDQHDDIEEWIDYHKSIAIGKFYIFDNNSTIPMEKVLEKYIESNLVRYEFVEHLEDRFNQLYVYKRCIDEFSRLHKFMAFIDADEFIVIANGMDLPTLMKQYKNYGGLTLNWKVFGSSGHVARPAGGVLRNYHACSRNHHVKSIVNTAHVEDVLSAHHFKFKKDFFAVDTNYRRIDGAFNLQHIEPANKVYEVCTGILETNNYIRK